MIPEKTIAPHRTGNEYSCFIIAEIGINHDGMESKARSLIEAAAKSGADAVKFQYRNLNNTYTDKANEIGDEMLSKEINRNYLSPNELIELSIYAKDLNLSVGISFFDDSDISDFDKNIQIFDFFKIPSVELTNANLIDALIKLNRHVYISLGAHNEKEIEGAFNRLPNEGWTPMHCISNYPVTLQNARLGYINYLKDKWQCNVGYSSHDDDWEVCILAMQLGVTVIERHITLDRFARGLDHSSSSTPNHFEKMSQFASNLSILLAGNSPRVPNQGELLNRQNLGRSYFTDRNISKGHLLQASDLVYRSPHTGLDKTNIDEFIVKPIQRDVLKGDVISQSVFSEEALLPQDIIDFARKTDLSLPVRLHDIKDVEKMFPIGSFEFHLSFDEVLSEIDFENINLSNKYSIHLPDYINPTQLIDPFSKSIEQTKASLNILERTVILAEKLQDLTGSLVPIVGSFSVVHTGRERFFEEHSSLFQSYLNRGVEIIPQWLPPIAWYFGGSIRLHVMNDVEDVTFIKKYNLGICMDVCHMILGRNFFDFSANSVMNDLESQIRHLHIADAIGIDGEGLSFGDGEPENISLIRRTLDYDCMKVIEVWQGHLDNGAGFRKALTKLAQLYEEK